MHVDVARKILILHLRSRQRLEGRRSDLTLAVWNWFNAYKAWEGEDTFLAAFRQKRLCITQRPSEENVKGAIQTVYQMKALRSTKENAPKIEYPGVTYSVGVDYLATRMNPENFSGVNEQGMKRKYALGLFDLSASLLNPEYATIKGQLRWTIDGTKGAWRVVFIPLPKPEDVALYNEFREFAQKAKDPVLLNMVKFIRHRMTRPKLAAAEDMGAGPYDVALEGAPAKIKYGFKSDNGVFTQQTIQRAKTAATNYQDIIKDAKPITGRGDIKVVASNEITIALRQRNGARFPVITIYDPEKDIFALPQRSDHFPNQYIPDAWKTTRESRMV
jgi:hypothetical protein